MRRFLICSLIVHGIALGLWGDRELLKLVREEAPVVRIKVVPEAAADIAPTMSVANAERKTGVRRRPKDLRHHILHHRAIHEEARRHARRQRLAMRLVEPLKPDLLGREAEPRMPDGEVTAAQEHDHVAASRPVLSEHHRETHKDAHRRARRQRLAMRLVEPPRPDLLEAPGKPQMPDGEVTLPQEHDHKVTSHAVLPENRTAMPTADEVTPAVQTVARELPSASPAGEEQLWPQAPQGEGDEGELGLYEPVRKNGVQLPAYPRVAREKGHEGTVMLRILVTPEGDVSEVVVEHSSGFSMLDVAALDAAKHWKFTPARRDGVAVAASVVVPVEFRLTN